MRKTRSQTQAENAKLMAEAAKAAAASSTANSNSSNIITVSTSNTMTTVQMKRNESINSQKSTLLANSIPSTSTINSNFLHPELNPSTNFSASSISLALETLRTETTNNITINDSRQIIHNGVTVSKTELDDVKSIISNFRISELQLLLSTFNVSQGGRKTELIKRAFDLLSHNFVQVASKTREIFRNMQLQTSNPGGEQQQRQQQRQLQHAAASMLQYGPPQPKRIMCHPPQNQIAIQSAGLSLVNQQRIIGNSLIIPFTATIPTEVPIHPDVRLKKLPFYEQLATLISPSTMFISGLQRTQKATYYFTLTPQQATEIAFNRDIRNGLNVEYKIQVQLRFCLLETSCEQDDCFPPNILIKVNNKMCQLPTLIPTNRPNVEPKRPSRPVNITPNVKLSPTVPNSIHVQWNNDFSRGYVISAYLVRKLNSQQLLAQLKAKAVKPVDYTRGLIKEKLSDDDDTEIATTMLKVSLICPLGKLRINIPCRASTCTHLQCFDASLFLQMNERKPTWNCPVCDKPAIYDTLVIDSYFQEVLSSQFLPPNVNEIQLHQDGTWSTNVGGTNIQPITTPLKKVEIISEDLELITEVQDKPEDVKDIKQSSSVISTEANISSSLPTVDIVDLTQSSEDDDMPLSFPGNNLPFLDGININNNNNSSSNNIIDNDNNNINNNNNTNKNNSAVSSYPTSSENPTPIISLDSPSPPDSPKSNSDQQALILPKVEMQPPLINQNNPARV